MSKVLNPWLFLYLEPGSVAWLCSNQTPLQARRHSPCLSPLSCTGDFLQWGLSVVPGKTGKRLKPSQPKFGVCSVFFDIFADDPVFGSYNAFAEGHCNNLLLVFHKMTAFLHQSSGTAHHETVEGDVHLGTNGSIRQSLDANMVIPKDALWQWVSLSPAPTVPNLLLALILIEIWLSISL